MRSRCAASSSMTRTVWRSSPLLVRRIVRPVGLGLPLGHGGRQAQGERRPPAELAVDRDVAPEQVAERSRDGEPESRSTELARRGLVGLGEALEQTGNLLLRHADARIDDAEDQFRAGRDVLPTHVQRYASRFRELRGIAEEVEQALAQLDDVGVHRADLALDPR